MYPRFKDFFQPKSRSLCVILGIAVSILFIISAIRVASSKPQPSQADSAQSENRKQLIYLIPHHVPLKIKVKNLDNEKWVRDLTVEVTNTSDKPIYFLELWVTLPEIVLENGGPVGFTLRYGRMEFVHFGTMALPEDIPIQPGETYTFKIGEKYQRGWEAHKARENKPNPKKVHLTFVQLSFGDGTGYNGTDAKPFPYRRAQSSTGSCREGPREVLPRTSNGPPIRRAPERGKSSSLSTTGSFKPVVFVEGESNHSSNGNAVSLPDLCCPGTSCIFHKNGLYQCVCLSEARTTQTTGCEDPEVRAQ